MRIFKQDKNHKSGKLCKSKKEKKKLLADKLGNPVECHQDKV